MIYWSNNLFGCKQTDKKNRILNSCIKSVFKTLSLSPSLAPYLSFSLFFLNLNGFLAGEINKQKQIINF